LGVVRAIEVSPAFEHDTFEVCSAFNLGFVESDIRLEEECRDMRRVSYIENSVQDIRYGLQILRKNISFTIVAVVTLALGIAANTTIFSTISAFLLRKPPVKDPDRLIVVSSRNAAREWVGLGLLLPTLNPGRRRTTSLRKWLRP
jgi:hypothetical protein